VDERIVWEMNIEKVKENYFSPSKPTEQQSISNPIKISAGLLYKRNTI
jgi:hypothetical protein